MTAAHLAELAVEAADFYAGTDPALARRFIEVAAAAEHLAERQARAEHAVRRHGPAAVRSVTG